MLLILFVYNFVDTIVLVKQHKNSCGAPGHSIAESDDGGDDNQKRHSAARCGESSVKGVSLRSWCQCTVSLRGDDCFVYSRSFAETARSLCTAPSNPGIAPRVPRIRPALAKMPI